MFQEYSGYSCMVKDNFTQYMNNLHLDEIGFRLIPWFVRNEPVYLQKYTDSRRKQIKW